MSSRVSSDTRAFLPRRNQRWQKGAEKCVYDWDKNGWTLRCTTRGHSHPCILVLERCGAGAEILLGLLDEGMLTGAALIDAAKAAEDRAFLEGL